jgi:hypothetical protein
LQYLKQNSSLEMCYGHFPYLKMSLLLIVAAEEADKLEKTKWAQYVDTTCI